MLLRRFALALCSLSLVPACSALVSPDTARLGATGTDTGVGAVDVGMVDVGMVDVGVVDAGHPLGDGGVTCATGCDDGIACTIDSCVMGQCHHMPSGAACSAGMHCSVTDGCVPTTTRCTSDAMCSDGNACNGTETCHPGAPGANAVGCVPGTPLDCRDAFACTIDACNPASGCTHTPSDAVCNAGCFVGATCQVGVGCTGGASMMCVPDGNGCTADPPDCDPATAMCLHPPRDDDRDGYPAAMVNRMPCPGGTDCDDTNPNIHPGAIEICNGIDDDCDGLVDEGGVCGTPGPDGCGAEQPIPLSRGAVGMMWTGAAFGTTIGNRDNYRTMCGDPRIPPPNGAADAVYYVDVPLVAGATPIDVTISTNNPRTNYDSVVGGVVGVCSTAGFASASAGGATARCNDDVSTTNHTSTITMCLPASAAGSARIHILVDGYTRGPGNEGTYDLTVTVAPHPGPICP